MLKPENNPYLRKYKGPSMCSCCDTLPVVESKDFCWSCQGLSVDDHEAVHAIFDKSTPDENREFIQMSITPELIDWYDSAFYAASEEVMWTRSADMILVGELPSPHSNYNWLVFGPPCPQTPMDHPMPLTSAPVASTTHSSTVTEHAPPAGGSARPPTLLNIPSVFDILSLF
jgi:hypothetical protein